MKNIPMKLINNPELISLSETSGMTGVPELFHVEHFHNIHKHY